MAFTAQEVFEKSLKAVVENNLVFIDEIFAYTPFQKTTYYDRCPDGSEYSEIIKEAILKNKIDMKRGLRAKWYADGNATTEIALYKLLSTDDEHDKLNGNSKPIQSESTIKVTFDREG